MMIFIFASAVLSPTENLLSAVADGSLVRTSLALVTKSANSPIDLHELTGNNALHLATCKRDNAILRLLLDHSRIPIEQTNFEGDTPFILACRMNRFDNAKLLIRFCANIRARSARQGSYAVHFAIRYHSFDFMKFLLRHGHPIEW